MRHETKSTLHLHSQCSPLPDCRRLSPCEVWRPRFDAFSAGTEVSAVSPYAIRVMKELGIDISQQRSKSLDEFDGETMDIVVTVCDKAKAVCPFFPGAKKTMHMSFPDPKGFTGSDEAVLGGFRTVRDEILRWIDATFGEGNEGNKEQSEGEINP